MREQILKAFVSKCQLELERNLKEDVNYDQTELKDILDFELESLKSRNM